MKFKGKPNEAVFIMARSRRNGKPKRTYLFNFDENGEHAIDEATISDNTLRRLKANFEVIEEKVDIGVLKRKELFAYAKELGVEVKPPITNDELRKAINEVM